MRRGGVGGDENKGEENKVEEEEEQKEQERRQVAGCAQVCSRQRMVVDDARC
jgi:hypothetical protein